MGVPRFFRCMSERWPCVLQTVSVDSAPPTDNLFLNLNSILVEAAVQAGGHGDTTAIMEHTEHSIEKLVLVIKPQSLIFLAVDGVIPRAKLIRHRSNKFRIAENMKLASAAASRRGEVLKTFDLNAITAGSEFMKDLVRRLKSFIQRKISQDNTWPPRVIISGSDVPGEADHKILEYVRNAKCSENWMPNQRHSFYGLDASTLMSALVIHEPHCYLFKEKSSKTKGSKGPAARVMLESHQSEEFMACSIGLLREYLALDLDSQLPRSFQLDIERAVDDFVLFCIIAGNDFLPALESFDGVDALMENLMDSYAAVLPQMGGYITQLGRIDGNRLQQVLEHCSRKEETRVYDRLIEIAEGMAMGSVPKLDQDFLFINNRAARDIFNQSSSPESAIRSWKERHYREKLCIEESDKATIIKQYFDGLSWSMRCFYRGMPSWSWFYPYHYSPMISDMKDMDPGNVLFRMGTPVSLLFYLMSVIPKASYRLVPKILQPLIVDSKSPIASYYPNDCHVDLEGKRQDWEAVVLLPFPEDRRLGQILSRIPQSRLSDEELERIKCGHALLFSSNDGLIRVHFCPDDPSTSHSSCRDPIAPRRSFNSDPCSLSSLKAFHSRLPKGTVTGTDAPAGYWTLHSLKISAKLVESSVCLFSYPSERRTLQLTLPPPLSSPELLIGATVYVDWPSLHKARVVRVEDKDHVTEKTTIGCDAEASIQSRRQTLTIEEWKSKTDKVTQRITEKKGIDPGPVNVLVIVKKIDGAVRRGLDQLLERYGPEEVYPLQAVLQHNCYPNHYIDVTDRQRLNLCAHDRLLYVGRDIPGTVVTVQEDEDNAASTSANTTPRGAASITEIDTGECTHANKKDEGLRVSVQVYSEASLASLKTVQRILRKSGEIYSPSGAVATRLGVTPQGLSRITGSLWVNTGNERQEVGLAVKLGSKNMCVAGYVRPSANGTGWEYTESLISILESYKNHFYWVFEAVDATPEGGEINLKTVFPRATESELVETVRRTKRWLSALPLAGRPLVTAEAHVGSIASIQQAQTTLTLSTRSSMPYTTRLPRSLLIPPTDRSTVRSSEAGGEMFIGDFVSYIGSALISFGSSGVVIGILFDQVEVLFSSKVLKSVSIFGDSTKQCSCLVSAAELINISRLMGEERTPMEKSYNRVNVHSQRVKNKSSSRSPGPSTVSQHSARRKGRSNWDERNSRVTPQTFLRHQSPPIHDPSCTIRPVVPIPPYGSGVYIPGMTSVPGVQGNVPPAHPMPYMNYSLTPRY